MAEVSVERATGRIRVHNFWCTIDPGIAVQPDNVIAHPPLHINLVATDNHPTGAGQMATPLVAPAIANAVYQVTGVRIRRTPMLPAQVKQALLEPAESRS